MSRRCLTSLVAMPAGTINPVTSIIRAGGLPSIFGIKFVAMKSRVQQIIVHTAGCLIFLALPALFSPSPSRSLNVLQNPATQRDIISYIMLIGFFYINFFLLIPRLYFGKRYLLFSIAVGGCFLLIIGLPSLISQHHFTTAPPSWPGTNHAGDFGNHPPAKPFENSFLFEVGQPILLFLVIFFFSLMLKISNRWKQTEKEKLNAEVSFLKAQINPHFLFNTLNGIYALAIRKDNRTAESIVQLSELMRYIIKDANDDKVPLEKEMNYIRNYVSLQKTRLGDTVIVNDHFKGETNGKYIAPLILISFIENAFKHGVNPDKNSKIEISIVIVESNLRLYIFNRKTSSHRDMQGIGLKNSKERLQLLYPSNYELVINDEEDSYSVHLLMTLV